MAMQGRARYPDSVVQDFIGRRLRKETNESACRALGINKKTGDFWWSRYKRNLVRTGINNAPPPKTLKKIRQSTVARKAYDDFAYFRLVVFGYKTQPWAMDAVEQLRAAVEERRKEFVCMNVHPGIGKSSLMMHFICWLIVRDRSIRIIWGSASEPLARKWVNKIRTELMRTEKGAGFEEDIASGRAVRPRYCLTELFGSFRPSGHHGTTWTTKEFTVSTPGDGVNDEGPVPEGPTLLALGQDTSQLGNRANFIVWDDLWTKAENDNPVQGNKMKRFFDDTIETRLQDNGTLVLVMQRLGPADLSRYVLDKRMPVLDEETGEEVGYEPEYRHIVYPAHHDDLCDGKHPKNRPAWDPHNPVEGNCITDPSALPPKDFIRIRGKPTYLVVYQQRDVDPQGAKFREIWLTGGRDPDGQTYPGCLDLDRDLWELPEGVDKSTLASAVSVDVGQEKYWALYASVHSTEPGSHAEWILAAEHRLMPAGTKAGLLDWDFERKCFVGMLDDWWKISNDIGVPFTHVVAEINCAQRHLFRDTNNINRWQLERNCRIIPHETKRNKTDKKIGVEYLLGMRMELGAARFPWRLGPTRDAMRDLYNEIVGYEQGWPTDDILMTMWMRTLNRKRVERPVRMIEAERTEPTGLEWASSTPKWVQGL